MDRLLDGHVGLGPCRNLANFEMDLWNVAWKCLAENHRVELLSSDIISRFQGKLEDDFGFVNNGQVGRV